jgi:hypothetical protein
LHGNSFQDYGEIGAMIVVLGAIAQALQLAFALGTLPALLSVSTISSLAKGAFQKHFVRFGRSRRHPPWHHQHAICMGLDRGRHER